MCQVPVCLGSLLHHVVPSEYLFLSIVIEQVEWRSRQSEHLCVLLHYGINDALPYVCLRTLVSLVHDEHVPGGCKHIGVLVELTAYGLCSSQVLHGGKINVAVALACQPFERLEALALGA